MVKLSVGWRDVTEHNQPCVECAMCRPTPVSGVWVTHYEDGKFTLHWYKMVNGEYKYSDDDVEGEEELHVDNMDDAKELALMMWRMA